MSLGTGLGSETQNHPDHGGRNEPSHRSSKAHPSLVNARLIDSELVLGACSGAVTEDFIEANNSYPTEPSQVSRDGTTAAVTVTLGGNDLGFSSWWH